MIALPMCRPSGAARARSESGGGWNWLLAAELASAATPQTRAVAAGAGAVAMSRRGRTAYLLETVVGWRWPATSGGARSVGREHAAARSPPLGSGPLGNDIDNDFEARMGVCLAGRGGHRKPAHRALHRPGRPAGVAPAP